MIVNSHTAIGNVSFLASKTEEMIHYQTKPTLIVVLAEEW